MIKFGTSGWRSIMADEFTFANVHKVVGAIGTHLIRSYGIDNQGDGSPRRYPEVASTTSFKGSGLKNQNPGDRPVLVGYDTRFLSPEFAQYAASILKKMGLTVRVSKQFIPTPVVSFQVLRQKAIGSVNFTASHNPSEYNGIKFNIDDGAPAPLEVTRQIEQLANGSSMTVPDVGIEEASGAPTFDPMPDYMKALSKCIDTRLLKKAKLKVGVDALYGTGMGYVDGFLSKNGCQVTVLHNWRDVRYGGLSPEPAQEQLQELVKTMKKQKLSAGFATDGDADRFGIVDDDGTLLAPNDILPLLLEHLVLTRKWKGFVARSVMTSHFLDAVAAHYGLPVKETPVGFKYIAHAMHEPDFVMGGEESGGMTIRGHVPEKDGILACVLMAEVRAFSRQSFRKSLAALRAKVGGFFSDRINLHLTQQAMAGVQKRLQTYTPNSVEHLEVKKIVRMDGYKFIFQDDSWIGVRLSGTEPVVRLYLEAATPPKLKALRQIGEKLIQNGH